MIYYRSQVTKEAIFIRELSVKYRDKIDDIKDQATLEKITLEKTDWF